MIIVDALPSSVVLGGREYQINTDYRNWILFEQMMSDRELSDWDKMVYSFDLFFHEDEDLSDIDMAAALKAVMWFYACGVEVEDKKGGGGSNRRVNIYSWEQDGEYIFAAFLDQYGIDLTQDELHWWKFRALFRSLKQDNEIVRIMGYRAMEISSDMPKEQQKYYREMKALYALEDTRTEEEKEQDFADSFAGLF